MKSKSLIVQLLIAALFLTLSNIVLMGVTAVGSASVDASHSLPQPALQAPSLNGTSTLPTKIPCREGASPAKIVCGVPGKASLVATVVLSQVPAPTAPGNGNIPFLTGSSQAIRSSPSSASSGAVLASINPDPPAIFARFNGLNEVVSCNSNCWPPDVQVAAGPNHVMEMVNNAGEVFDKQGNVVRAPFGLGGFFNTGTDSITDPKVLFDVLSGRWFASIDDISGNKVRIAVSSSNNPTGAWNIYEVLGYYINGCPVFQNCFLDQPIIGVSNDKFVVSINDYYGLYGFCPNSCNYAGAQYWVLAKRQMIEGKSTIDMNTFGPNTNDISIHPAQATSSTDALYMVEAGITPSGTTNTVQEFVLTGLPPNTGVTINQFAMQAVANPPGAAQPGTPLTVNPDDARVSTAAWFNGKLWFALNDGCVNNAHVCLRLAEIDTQALTLVQNFDVSLLNAQNNIENLYYPALTIDSMGNMALVYGYSDANDFPSVAVTEQAVGDGINTIELPQVLVAGNTIENFGRYGDYFGAGVDPANTADVWVAGEYMTANAGGCQGFNCWSTFIGGMQTTDFRASASPGSLTILAGSSGTSTTTMSSIMGFSASIGLASQASVSITATSIDDNNCRSIGLIFDQTLQPQFWNTQPNSVISPPGGACGSFPYSNTYSLGTGGHYLEFGVSAYVGEWRAQITVNGVLMVTVDTDVNNHVHVAFQVGGVSVSGGPAGATPPTASASPSSVTPSAGGSATSTLTISSSSSTSLGTYTVTVTAGSAGLSHSTTVSVTLVDFSISASPTTVAVNPGSSGTSTVTVTALNGFSGTVNLAFSISPSTGLTCSLTPTSITGSGSSALSCNGSVGAYTVTVTGTSGTLSHSTTVTYSVQDFSLSASPSATSLTLASSSATSTVTIASLGGFSSAVSLTASVSPSGPVVSVWPNSVTPSAGGSVTSTLDISAGGATPGTYTITVTGTSGSLVHTTMVTVNVAGDFSSTASPATLTVPAGSSGASTITLASLNGFSGTISLASSANVTISAVDIDDGYFRAFGLTIDQTLYTPDFWNQQPGSIIGDASGIFSYSHTFPLSTGSHFIEFGVSAWVGHWHAKIWVNGVLMANVDTNVVTHVHVPFQVGGVSVSPLVTNGPTGSLSATSATLSAGGSAPITLTITTTSSTPAQNYVFTVTASSGGVFHATTVTVKVLDFSITTSPTSQSLILAGSSTTSTVTVASLNGFSTTVSLTASTSPAGLVVSLWPNSVTISSGGSATSTLSISAGWATPGTYTVTVSGTGGGLSHSATVTITVAGDFGISASPSSLSIAHGSSGTSTLTLTSLNGFAGTITLPSQASVSITATSTDDPYQRSFGLLFDQTLNPDFWNSQPGSVIGVSYSPFSYSNTYSLSSGSHFLEFGVSAFVGHWHVQITVNGVVVANVDTDVSHHVHSSFSVGGTSVSPLVSSGPTVSFSANSATLSSGGSAAVTMTISTAHKTPTGTYTITVIATSGGLSHSITVTVTVT